MITVIVGKTASGKTAILNELVKSGCEKITAYTTRPPRKGEKQNKAYNFISEEEFIEKMNNGFFAEYQYFDTTEGRWYYGSAMQDYTDGKVVILTPAGLSKIKNIFDTFSIYLYSNRATIFNRLKKRKDKKEEAERRVRCDDIDFKEVENQVDKIVYNNSGADITEVTNKIVGLINNARRKRNEEI